MTVYSYSNFKRFYPQPLPPYIGIREWFRRFEFNTAGYNRLGLYHDDLIYEWPDVAEAVRRLPSDLKDERNWRMIRSIQLDIKQELLPESEWTKYEDDITKGRYLKPYLDEVRREIKEQDQWIAEH